MGSHICEFMLRILDVQKPAKITSQCFVVMSPTIGAVGSCATDIWIVDNDSFEDQLSGRSSCPRDTVR